MANRSALVIALGAVGLFYAAGAEAQSTVSFGAGASGNASTSTGAQGTSGATGAASGASAAPAASSSTDVAASGAGAGTMAGAGAGEDEWAERDMRLNEAESLSGGTGLLHMQHAQSGAPGQFRLAFTAEYFSAGFLCTSDFPCKNKTPGGAPVTNDSLDHIGGTIGLSVTLAKWLEAYAATSAYANSDDQNRPSLLQVLGDTDLGLKVFGGLSKVFWLGGFGELWLINGTGAVGLDGGGTSFKFGPIGTMDFRGLEKKVPLRFSLQADYMFDNTGDVLAQTESDRGDKVTRIERFGLNVNRVDHFDVGIGGELFAAEERVRPFIEYNILVPTNRQDYKCKLTNASNDKCLANDQIAPSKLTIGGRFYPWKKGFSIMTALDIGITGTSDFVEELAPTPPWTFFLGAGWAIDTRDRPAQVSVRTVEKVGARSRVKGFVHEQGKTDALANAVVVWSNHPENTSLVTGPDGRFTTMELGEGNYAFTIKADGYKDGACTADIGKAPADVQVDCAVEALPKVGAIVGHVLDADSHQPIQGARVKVVDANKKELSFTGDASGGFRGEDLAGGNAEVTVEVEGYLTLVQPVDVKVRQDNPVDLLVHKRPAKALVNVGKKEIIIKQQIQFAVDSAVILPESLGLMSEIADAIIHTPRIHRIEIQGHTDNSGTADHNKILSEQRATAVKDWLVAHGVTEDRVVARGYGQDKPLVPNVTSSNKARNRRVQFVILEQDPAPAATPAAPAPAGGATKPAAPKTP